MWGLRNRDTPMLPSIREGPRPGFRPAPTKPTLTGPTRPGHHDTPMLPAPPVPPRPGYGYMTSIVLHLLLLLLVFRTVTQNRRAESAQRARTETSRPIPLDFAPPRPTATPRQAPAPMPPGVPVTPGPDATPGTSVPVTPTPESDPNAPPNTPRQDASRPDPGSADQSTPSTPEPTAPPASLAAPGNRPTLESEAERLFGRPSSKLGPLAGTRDNRPWESPIELNSRGCALPPPDSSDATTPPGMAVVSGRVFNERTGDPLSGARLQILGTPYGAFANDRGDYTLYFARSLVDRCRSQSVRVTAPGYRGRDVILYIGATPNGDVPLSRY